MGVDESGAIVTPHISLLLIYGERAMTISTDRRMTLQEYLDYDDGTDTRYELVDGVLVEMGAESHLNIDIAMFLLEYFLVVLKVSRKRLTLKTEIAVPLGNASTRYPDLMVLTDAGTEALKGKARSLITFEMPAPSLVVEVVSPGEPGSENYERDYIQKRLEYAARGIPEYWIIDPSAMRVTVCTLVHGQYQSAQLRDTDGLVSSTFSDLNLTAVQILQAGQ